MCAELGEKRGEGGGDVCRHAAGTQVTGSVCRAASECAQPISLYGPKRTLFLCQCPSECVLLALGFSAADSLDSTPPTVADHQALIGYWHR